MRINSSVFFPQHSKKHEITVRLSNNDTDTSTLLAAAKDDSIKFSLSITVHACVGFYLTALLKFTITI